MRLALRPYLSYLCLWKSFCPRSEVHHQIPAAPISFQILLISCQFFSDSTKPTLFLLSLTQFNHFRRLNFFPHCTLIKFYSVRAAIFWKTWLTCSIILISPMCPTHYTLHCIVVYLLPNPPLSSSTSMDCNTLFWISLHDV